MRPATTLHRALGIAAVALVIATVVTLAWAQAPTAPGPSPAPRKAILPTPSTEGEDVSWPAFLLVIALLVIGNVTIRVLDFKRNRAGEVMHLEARISDALLRDPMLFRLPVAASARIPVWRHSPVKIEVNGQVPKPELRRAVLRLVELEASRIRSSVRIDDRIAIVPSAAPRAA